MLRALDKALPWSVRPVSAELSPARLVPATSGPLDLAELLQLDRARSLVRVRGDLEPGWRDGDYLLLEDGDDPRDGDTVLALVDGAPTIGRLARRRGALELHPDRGGPAVPAELVEVRGVVVGAIRGVPLARCG
jgi:SOS-response transcriptional repressor LexA